MLEEPSIEVTQQMLSSLKMSKIFKDHVNYILKKQQKDINSIDFSKDGQYLVSCDDQTLNVYDVVNGKKLRTLYNKNREIDLVKFTHHNSAVICATKKEPYEIYYWSLHENQILKKFIGHTDIIVWLDLSPVSDDFISCSRDGTLRIWNLSSQSQQCDGILDLSSKKTFCIASFDPTGCVFAVVFLEEYYGVQNNWIYLYDFKKYDQQNAFFDTRKLQCGQVRCLKFSCNNKYILCATSDGTIVILDAYNLKTICELNDFSNEGTMIEASFTPDCNYVISGSETGSIFIWVLPTGQLISKLEGHQKRCKCVKFSPTYSVMASGCRNLVLWTPESLSNFDILGRKGLMSV